MVDLTTHNQLKYHRIYPDARDKRSWYGESHIESVGVEQSLVDAAPPAPPLYLSVNKPASSYLFYSAEPGWTGDWHLAPARQFMVLLSGALEVETSDGDVRRFGPGDVVLLEDTWGKGHKLRNLGDNFLHFFVVQIPVT